MNKNLKIIAALLLAIAMIASFAACKKDKDNNDTTAAGDVAINGDAIADDLLPEASSEAASDDTAVETEIVTDKELSLLQYAGARHLRGDAAHHRSARAVHRAARPRPCQRALFPRGDGKAWLRPASR